MKFFMVPALVFYSVIVATLSSTFYSLIELSLAVYLEQSLSVTFRSSVVQVPSAG